MLLHHTSIAAWFLPQQDASGACFHLFRRAGSTLESSPKTSSKCKFFPRKSSSRCTNLLVSMPGYLESALGATEEVRERADYLSRTVPEAEQEVNYKLLQTVIEDTVRRVFLR